MEVTRTEQSQSPTAGRVSITSRWTTRDSTASSRTAQHSCICLSAESDLKCKVSTPFHQPGPSAQNQPRRTNRRRSQLTRRDPCRQQVGIEDAPAHAHRAGSQARRKGAQILNSRLPIPHLAPKFLRLRPAALGFDHLSLACGGAPGRLSPLARTPGRPLLPISLSQGFKLLRQPHPSHPAVPLPLSMLGDHHMQSSRAVNQPHQSLHFIDILPPGAATAGKTFLDVIWTDAAITETHQRGSVGFHFSKLGAAQLQQKARRFQQKIRGKNAEKNSPRLPCYRRIGRRGGTLRGSQTIAGRPEREPCARLG